MEVRLGYPFGFLSSGRRKSFFVAIKGRLVFFVFVGQMARFSFPMESASFMSFCSEFPNNLAEGSDFRHGGGRLKEVLGQSFEVNLDFSSLPDFIGGERVLPHRQSLCIASGKWQQTTFLLAIHLNILY